MFFGIIAILLVALLFYKGAPLRVNPRDLVPPPAPPPPTGADKPPAAP